MSAAERPVPVTDDPDTAGFFAAAARGALAVCACATCGATLHLPMPWCRHCGSDEVTWRDTAGTGRLHAWTVVEHQVHPAFPVPHTLVLVDVDGEDGVRLLGRLDGRPALRVGQAMTAVFETLPDGTVLPQWQPDPS